MTNPISIPDPSTPLLSLCTSISSLFTPPPRLTLSEWAERNIILSPEYSANTSYLKLFGWQREPFDAFTDPRVEEITLRCSTQLMKTLFIQCCLAYIISEAPGPALMVYPKEDDAKAFSKERLAPMLRDCPSLHGLVSDSDRAGNQILNKEFPGGSIALVGAGAPGNLARRSIRYLFGDEIDKYPLSSGKEGDPMSLAKERTVTFGARRKIVRACSPTIAGLSRISLSYSLSDQRKPWVPCWSCGKMQILRWAQVKWESSGPPAHHIHHPETSYYECSNPACKARWNDKQRWQACQKAEWRAEKPFTGHAGFWISHLYSPWKKLSDIAKEFLNSKDDRNKFQTFINTNLAEDWEEQGETPDAEVLFARREDYPYGDAAVVPMRGLFLTAAVDVQENPPRLEVEVAAWGRGRERWSVDYRVIQAFAPNGQPLPVTSKEVWDKLDQEVLQRSYPHASGHTLPIMAMGIDTGFKPKPVYDFTLRHPRLAYGPSGLKLHTVRTVVPVRGTDDPLKIISSVSKENASRRRQGIRIVGIGTHCVKQELFDALKHIKPKPDSQPTPGCHHFPLYDMDYFNGVCSEVKIIHENGKVEYQKRQGQYTRNEPLDLLVYNRAMAAVVGIDRFGEDQWRQLEKQVGMSGEKTAPAMANEVGTTQTSRQASTAVQSLPPERQSSFPSSSPSSPSAPLTQAAARRPVRGRF